MDNINNTQEPEVKENNKKLIIISSIAIVALVAVFVILGLSLNWFGSKKDDTKATSAVPVVKVVKTKGSDGDTRKMKISIRDVKFGDSLKKVKKFEKSQKDTQDNPSEATSKDGYTYLTYLFAPKKAKFFGVSPAPSNTGSLLQYVFKDKKLFDIRVQYGDIGSKDLAKIKDNITKKYGKPTYSIKYSNKSTKDNWRTANKEVSKQTILSLNYSPSSNVIVDYETLSR